MSELFSSVGLLMDGFSNALSPSMLVACLVGAMVGTMVGVLPGLGPSAAVAILLPMIYGLDPLQALITLAGIYYGAMYGGTISSVLLGLPGESASVVTTFDGYPMAKAGKGGIALGISAVGSFVAGTIGLILLTLVAMPLAQLALKFGPPEYFAFILFSLALVAGLSGGDRLKSYLALFIGLLLATVGIDVVTGQPRLTAGSAHLLDGISFLPAIVGAFGLAEILYDFTHPTNGKLENNTKIKMSSVFPKMVHYKQTIGSMLRGSFIGFITGILPGSGGSLSSFLSYGVEKRVSKNPENFGKGAIQGVAGPESANNSASSAAFVPLLSLGIPGSGTTAVLLGAFVMLGIQPGPGMFTNHPDIVWGLIASMYIGNIMLLLINTAGIPVFVWLLKKSQASLSVIVTTLCFVGVYSINNSMFDIWVMLFFTIFGYACRISNIPLASLILALVLGKEMENTFRQSMVMSMGSPEIFLFRPISATLIIVTVLIIVLPPLLKKYRKRHKDISEDQSI